MRVRFLAAGGDSALAPNETSARLRDQGHDLTVAVRQRVGPPSGRRTRPDGGPCPVSNSRSVHISEH